MYPRYLVDDVTGGFRRIEFCHGCLFSRQLSLILEPCRIIGQKLGRLDPHLHLGDLFFNKLKLADRPSECLALPRIIKARHERAFGKTNP